MNESVLAAIWLLVVGGAIVYLGLFDHARGQGGRSKRRRKHAVRIVRPRRVS